MHLNFSDLDPKTIYQTMIQCIVPRPIAWVLSNNGDHSLNLAPFSYFNGVASRPPIISISVGKKRDGSKKDTWRNIEERTHFVVHLSQADQAPLVSATAASLAFGESEVSANDLKTVQDESWSLPRLEIAPVAMLCQRHQIVEVGDTPQGLVLGRITQLYVSDQLTRESTGNAPQIDATGLNPLARLGGDDYAAITAPFTVERPS